MQCGALAPQTSVKLEELSARNHVLKSGIFYSGTDRHTLQTVIPTYPKHRDFQMAQNSIGPGRSY